MRSPGDVRVGVWGWGARQKTIILRTIQADFGHTWVIQGQLEHGGHDGGIGKKKYSNLNPPPEPESEVTTVCKNFWQKWLVLSTTGATPLLPTPNPTRTPTVALSIALSGATCADYDQSLFFAALRVPPGGAAFDDAELHRRRLHRSGKDAPSLRATSPR